MSRRFYHIRIFLILPTLLISGNIPNAISQPGEIYFSTYIGGADHDFGGDAIIDQNGNLLVFGVSREFDRNKVTFDFTSEFANLTSENSVFVNEYSNSGEFLSKLMIGGSEDDEAVAIMLDSFGNLIIVGTTDSIDFPTLNTEYTIDPNTHPYSFVGTFVSKFSPSRELLWSAVFSGSNGTGSTSAALDENNNIFLSIVTFSTDFPVVGGTPHPGGETALDPVVCKISPDGEMLWSTYVIGSNVDYPGGITFDNSGNLYITGATYSPELKGNNESYIVGYVIKFSPMGEILWSMILEEPGINYGGIELNFDPNDETILLTAKNLGGRIYLYRISLNGEILWNTQFGKLFSYDTEISSDGSIYIVGSYSTEPNNFDTQDDDVFILKLSSQGELIANATFGGSDYDGGSGLIKDQQGRLIIVGSTRSQDFPLVNPHDNVIEMTDAFLTIVDEKFLKNPNSHTSQYRISWALLPGLIVIALQTNNRRTHKPL